MKQWKVRVRETIYIAVVLGVLGVVLLPEHTLAETAKPDVLVDGFVRAWNTHDMKAFGSLFTEDADWVSVVGIWVKGRADIQAEHEKAHATWAKTTTLAATGTTVRLLSSDVAVIHSNWELIGQVDKEGKPAGPRRGIITIVAVMGADGWKITAGQNTNSIQQQ